MKSLHADTAKSKAVCSPSGFVLCSLLDFSAARAIKMQNAVMYGTVPVPYAVQINWKLFQLLLPMLLQMPFTVPIKQKNL